VEEILLQAQELEGAYDWLGAVELYKKVLSSPLKDDSTKIGTIHEKLASGLYHLAFQAAKSDEFKDRLTQSAINYGEARKLYENLNEELQTSRITRCEAMKAYIDFWLAPTAAEKKKLIDECWDLAKRSLKAFETEGESSEYGTTYVQLASAAIFSFTRESDFKSREKTIREAVESGEEAIQFLSGTGDSFKLSETYAITVVCDGLYGYYFQDLGEREKYRQKGLSFWNKAKEISEMAALTQSVYPVFGGQPFFGLEGTDEAIAHFEKALEYGRKMKDNFITGCALDWLVYHMSWKMNVIEDAEARNRLIEKITQYAEEARHLFSILSFVSPRGDTVWLESIGEMRLVWSVAFETNLGKRRKLYEQVLQTLPNAKRRAEESGYPEIRMYMSLSEAALLVQLAQSETDLVQKKRILEEALIQGNKSFEITENLEPFLYWNRGIMRNLLSTIKSELANLAEESGVKKSLLEEAITDKEDATKLLIRELKFLEKKDTVTSLFATVGGQYSTYGNLLLSLYDLICDGELLKKAVGAYEDAIQFFQKLNLATAIAGAYWKKAQANDKMGEYALAYQSFEMARANFAFASEKVQPLRDFFREHSDYMHAWSQIEKARQHHEKQEYGLAQEHFAKASKIHAELKRWNYLSPNYSAWAEMDHAEDLSRNEDGEKALEAFTTATKLFEQTKESIQNQLDKIEDLEEKEMAKKVLKATGLRHEYCVARTAVEEARILDKKGDHLSSSEKYDSAAETLERIAETADSERDKKELRLTAVLSRAWGRMTLAEAEEDPAPYMEASELFEKAKELSSSEKAKTLALGHSRFCRALEAGMKFADTGDEELHAVAVKQLESAARYYLKAGVQTASEYAKATELLLDAYSHINDAKKETDPEKKTRIFAVAEKILQTSAGSFMKAEHPEKREQVLRLLGNVKEERELAQSLNEVLHTPPIVSTTTVFAAPAPDQESSVGSGRLENANVQANIKAHHKRVEVGEHLQLDVELINAGKSPAQLIKITEIVPSGFELAENTGSLTIEDSYIDLKGRLLGPLKTENVRLVVKSRAQGTFTLNPTILYLDENGKYKSCEPDPVDITVKELGIKGWLKGER